MGIKKKIKNNNWYLVGRVGFGCFARSSNNCCYFRHCHTAGSWCRVTRYSIILLLRITMHDCYVQNECSTTAKDYYYHRVCVCCIHALQVQRNNYQDIRLPPFMWQNQNNRHRAEHQDASSRLLFNILKIHEARAGTLRK